MEKQIRKILREAFVTEDSFKEFADTRESGAEKIANTAKEKGGFSLLTWHHFKVKLPYYKKAANGKFDIDAAKKLPDSAGGFARIVTLAPERDAGYKIMVLIG
jgi:hypothetical protein